MDDEATPQDPPDSLPTAEGPSFSRPMKVLATLMIAAPAVAGWSALEPGAWSRLDRDVQWIALALAVFVLLGYWNILTSRTGIDGRSIHQRSLWTREVPLASITQVKLIHVPALSWLIAPRLVVRTGGISVTTFHAADPAVIQAFRRLAYG